MKTIQTDRPPGYLMSADRFHLMAKDSPRDTCPTLIANLNIIFNYLCNRFTQEENLCCSDGIEKM